MIESSRNSRLPSIQVLRGIAASLVVYYHYSGLFEGLSPRYCWFVHSGFGTLGASGVDIFFVISGFIMVYTTTRKAGASDAVGFLRRRAHRIYPLYWVWTSALFCLWRTGIALKTYHFSPSYVVKSYLLIPAYDGTAYRPLLAVGWTLSFEMFFYVAFSCAILLRLKRGKLAFLAGFFAFTCLLAKYLLPQGGMRFLLTDPIILEFLFGAFAAEVLLRFASSSRGKVMRILPATLIGLGSASLIIVAKFHMPDFMRAAYYGIPALSIVFGAALLGSRECPRWLVFLGDASYSIYLTHTIVVMVFDWVLRHFHLVDRVSPDISILLAAPITIALCCISYPLVERPLTASPTRRRELVPRSA